MSELKLTLGVIKIACGGKEKNCASKCDKCVNKS